MHEADSGELTRRLDEAERTLGAIQSGEVDAVIVHGEQGIQVYTLEGADAFYRVLVERMPEGAAAVRRDGTIVYANATMGDLLGVTAEQVIGSNLCTLTETEADREVLTELLATAEDERTGDVGFRLGWRSRVDVALSVSPIDADTLCVLAVDLTQRKADEAAIRRAEERFRGAFDKAPIGMALLDPDGVAVRVNPALCTILELPADDLLGAPLPWFVGDGELAATLENMSDGIAFELSLGEEVWADIHVSAVRTVDGAVQHFIAQVQDVSERREHQQRLQFVADHDNLTGLLNRRGFEIAMENHLSVTKRYGAQGALILLDVDHFKYINDARGHQVGDAVLMAVGQALQSRLRESDVLARLGGDEFAILLARGDTASARVVAEQIVATARDVQIAELVGLRRLTVSAGVAVVDGGAATGGELFGRADLAMYDAKEAGRDGFVVYDPSAGEGMGTEQRMTWLRRIKDGLELDELIVHAQPIVSLADGSVVARELLVRLPGTDRLPVVAATWFEIAERYDLATAIDEWMIDYAVELLRRYGRDGDPTSLNVNVSAISIGRNSLLQRLRAALDRTGVDASRLTVEITETAAIGNIAAAARFAEELRALGCRLALDDFGAGFGSFYYLKHLPFDDVKLDGEFVRNSVNDPRDRAIIRAMVDVARATGRRTVAESIEDVQTLDLMRVHGVDLAQGYHLGRPVAVEDA